jgi:ATP-dependent Clp protease ATP-binding subunit ClpB
MSEYSEEHTVARLIGAPPGYIGYEEGGQLTEAVRRHPYSVILFDEIEKAHPQIMNIFLQLFDDGRLTDGKGRTVDFKNTVIIMTSNLGGELIREGIARPWAEVRSQVLELATRAIKPEVINRIDQLIVFHALTKDHMGAIVEIELEKALKPLTNQDIKLNINDQVKKHLADKGYDPVYGARPLRRLIESEILDPLASLLLSSDSLVGQEISLTLDGQTIATQVL